jgi:pyruvate kinase
VIGWARRLTPPIDPALRIDPGDIIVIPSIDRTTVPILRRALGLVTAANDQDTRDRMIAMEMGLPAVIGIREGVEAIPDGMRVVLDAKRGLVYERPQTLVRMET